LDSPPVLREELAIPAHEDHSKEVIEWWDKHALSCNWFDTPDGQIIFSELKTRLKALHACDQLKVWSHIIAQSCPIT
jgi:hypothetical protein